MLTFKTYKFGFDTEVFFNNAYLTSISSEDIESFKAEFYGIIERYSI